MISQVAPARNVEIHRKTNCPDQEIPCDICKAEVKRKDIRAHLNDPNFCTTHSNKMIEECRTLRKENRALKKVIARYTKIERDHYRHFKAQNYPHHYQPQRQTPPPLGILPTYAYPVAGFGYPNVNVPRRPRYPPPPPPPRSYRPY